MVIPAQSTHRLLFGVLKLTLVNRVNVHVAVLGLGSPNALISLQVVSHLL